MLIIIVQDSAKPSSSATRGSRPVRYPLIYDLVTYIRYHVAFVDTSGISALYSYGGAFTLPLGSSTHHNASKAWHKRRNRCGSFRALELLPDFKTTDLPFVRCRDDERY